MSNKKCISTYLLVAALICLLTLVVPFTKVGFVGEIPTALKIFYYIFLVLYIICLSLIIVIGIFSLFKNSYEFSTMQEILSYCALFCVMLTAIIFLPTNYGLSVGYSILIFETSLLSCLNYVLKLIKELPKNIEIIKQTLKKQKERINSLDNQIENESVDIAKENEETIIDNSNLDDDEVLIIPSDDNNED